MQASVTGAAGAWTLLLALMQNGSVSKQNGDEVGTTATRVGAKRDGRLIGQERLTHSGYAAATRYDILACRRKFLLRRLHDQAWGAWLEHLCYFEIQDCAVSSRVAVEIPRCEVGALTAAKD